MVKRDLRNLFSSWPFLPKNLNSKRTYIFPTRFGIYFALSMFLLLGIAFIYSNNVVYFICFFLSSLGLVTMWKTNLNIERIKIRSIPVNDFFADENGRLQLIAENTGRWPSYLVKIRLRNHSQVYSIDEITSRASQTLDVVFSAQQRGYQKIPDLIIESEYPFGWLRSWKYYRVSQPALVYPKREGISRLPEKTESEGQEISGKKYFLSSENIFQGHRPYQKSDSLRQIDWKALARTRELLVKQFESESKGSLQLCWDDIPNSAVEKKLSQLSLWIHECEKQNRVYQLVLPHEKSPWGSGTSHARECLKKLALFGETNAD